MRLRMNKGFSLIELMVVVAIIGILAAIAIPNFQRFQRKARQSEAKALLGGLFTAEAAFNAEWSGYYGAFLDIGYAPVGNMKYNVGFGTVGTGPTGFTANATATGTGKFHSNGWCGAVLNCSAPSTTIAGQTDPSNSGYKAIAIGYIGSPTATNNDTWSMDHTKNLTNNNDGTF
jgi:type IV pilus assembly protein PilA